MMVFQWEQDQEQLIQLLLNSSLKKKENQLPEEKGYEPRPMWQVWAARVALVLFILIVIYQFMAMVTGGMA